ncbi:hypothetical protein Micbo1qcDRAFT_169139 [Microdochium bolleyi]|uniref:Uncharacterized protein n=1 Tax=Microdochium bolleyi TaxID=196109 RepID=A0A136ILB3_9PEZI|nr:hypothetical protein Micbo1qcDRAFT_169139 [Microdochium bolleyi]
MSTMQSTRPRIGLLSLPTEVLDYIIQLLSSNLLTPASSASSHDALFTHDKDPHAIARDRRRRAALSHACRSCKKLASVATRHLYRSVTIARREHSLTSGDNHAFHFSADSAVLLLRTLVEGGDRLRGLVGDIRSFLILKQAHTYRQAFWPVHDPTIVASSWRQLAHAIRTSAIDSVAGDILRYCGLVTAGSPNRHGVATVSTDAVRSLPERIIAAILLLCYNVRFATLACPPWDTQVPTIHARYTVLNQLVRGVVDAQETGLTLLRDTWTTQPLRHLQVVTFTGMQGLTRSRVNELYTHDGFARGYLARGDACTALARVPSVTEVSSHGTVGGWEHLLAPDSPPAYTRLPSPPPDGPEEDDVADRKCKPALYKSLRIGSASLNTALEALNAEGVHTHTNNSGIACTYRIQPHTIQELVLFQSTIHDAPISRNDAPLDIDLCNRALAGHARSLKALDMMTCWDLVSAPEPSAPDMMDPLLAQVQEQQQARTPGPPRPMRSLALLDRLEVLRIPLPLIATNLDLWRFYGMLGVDIIAAVTNSRNHCPPDEGMIGDDDDSRDLLSTRYETENEPQTSSSTGALTCDDVPFLRCLPRSLKVLRIADYYFLPHSPYWARQGEYGSGYGVPSFNSYKDADATASALAIGVGHTTCSRRNSSSSSPGDSDDDDDYGADSGGDGWTAATAAGPSTADSVSREASTTLPLSPSLSFASTAPGSSNQADENDPTREFTHKYLLPLALRRFAGVCRQTHPHLTSVVVDTMPMLRYMPLLSGNDRAVPIDWLVRGGTEIREMFAAEGVRFEAVYDPENAGKMEFGVGY